MRSASADSCSGSSSSSSTGTGEREASASSAPAETARRQLARVKPGGEPPHVRERVLELLGRALHASRPLRIAVRDAARLLELGQQHRQPPFGRLLQPLLEAAPLVVGGREQPAPRRLKLGDLRAHLGLQARV